MRTDYTWTGILLRIVAALALVLVTFNPSGISYFHWVTGGTAKITAFQVVCGLLLVSGWLLYARAAIQSLGRIGLLLTAAVLAALVWWLVSLGVVHLDRPGTLPWVLLLALGFLLGFGLSWSLLRKRLTGQVDVDELPQP